MVLAVMLPEVSVGIVAEPELTVMVPEVMVSPVLGERMLMLPFSTLKSPPAWRLCRWERSVGATAWKLWAKDTPGTGEDCLLVKMFAWRSALVWAICWRRSSRREEREPADRL